jgi:hypothetical protein
MGRSVNQRLPPAQFASLTDAPFLLFVCLTIPVSIFGFLSLGLIPIPLIFIRYGKQLRARSRYAKEAQDIIMRMRECNYADGERATTISEEGVELPPITTQEVGDLGMDHIVTESTATISEEGAELPPIITQGKGDPELGMDQVTESTAMISEQGVELPLIIAQEIGDPELGMDHIVTEMKLL